MKTAKIINIAFKNLRFVFLIILLTFFVRFDGYQPVSENFIHYSNDSDIELVISENLEDDLTTSNFNPFQKKLNQLDNSEITRLPNYKISLLHFNQSVNHRFTSIEQSFIQFYSYISIIQKNNIWHQNIYDADDFSC